MRQQKFRTSVKHVVMKMRARSFAKKESTVSRHGLGPELVVIAKSIDVVASVTWKAARFRLDRQAAIGWPHMHGYLPSG